MKCPRRIPFFPYPEGDTEDRYTPNDTCSYCGSMNPDLFMARLETGTLLLGATDKNYKVYVTATEGSDRLLAIKFYFQHLSEAQMRRFVELYNEKKLKFKNDFPFYAFPFFMVPAAK